MFKKGKTPPSVKSAPSTSKAVPRSPTPPIEIVQQVVEFEHGSKYDLLQPEKETLEKFLGVLGCKEIFKLSSETSGTQSSCFKVVPPNSTSPVVIKALVFTEIGQRTAFNKEQRCLEESHISHKNIVKFFSSFHFRRNDSERCYQVDRTMSLAQDDYPKMSCIVLEHLEQTLESHFSVSFIDTFTAPMLLEVFKQIGGALVYLHQMNITHNDINLGNIAIVHADSKKPLLKLLDFGSATIHTGDLFQAAENHCSTFELSTLSEANDDLENNQFLDESLKFIMFLLEYATECSTYPKMRDLFAKDPERHFKTLDKEFKSILLRMASPKISQTLTITRAFNYLKF